MSGQSISDVFCRTDLVLRHYRGGLLVAEHRLGPGLITQAGMTRLAQDWNNTTAALKLANFHDFGNGSAAPLVTDTQLASPSIQRAARVVGTQSNPSIGIYESDGLMSFTGSDTIREWGLFLATSGGVLFDRRTFTGIPVVVSDQVEARWSVEFPPGG